MLFQAREKRIFDAVALKVPDRVPITASFYFFPARYYGYTMQELMYDPQKLWDSHMRVTLEFEPDLAQNPYGLTLLGPILDTLGYLQMQWPGGQLEANVPYQFVEGEYMKADEYDHFLSDPLDFIVRRYWPRISDSLKPLADLPSLTHNTNFLDYGIFGIFANPAMQAVLDTVKKAGQQTGEIIEYSRKFTKKLIEEGFPSQGGGRAQAPFDQLGDYLRGTKGLMLDMYRRPEVVLKACEKILDWEIERGIASARNAKSQLVFIPLHKGLDGFMSLEQFQKFYWPTLRELTIALINEGLTPYLFWEGNCTSRLPYIKDIPPGKAMYRFEATDLFKAKDHLKETVCIRGNVPISLLSTGTPDDVRAYCKKLIDYVGRDGGYIMDAAAHITDAKPENVKAMFDANREYGVY